MKWHRNPTTEFFLNRIGVPYTYSEGIPFHSINVEKGLKNNARLIKGQLDTSTRDTYAVQMKLPDASFPAGVLIKRGSKYDVIDFNHRLNAFEYASLATANAKVGAYVIETDDARLITMVTRSINVVNGLAHSDQDKIAHAIATFEQNPSSTQKSEIADMFGLTTAKFNACLRANETATELSSMGLRAEHLNQSSLVALGKLSKQLPVLMVAAQAVLDLKMNCSDVDALVKSAGSTKSEAKAIGAVEAFVENYNRRPVNAITKKGQSRSTRLKQSMTTIDRYLDNSPTWDSLGITAESDKDVFRGAAKSLGSKLRKLLAS